MKHLVDFKKIENKDQLLEWSTVVSQYGAGSGEQWTDLQDVFGRSNAKLIDDMAVTLKGTERRLVFFAVWKCNGDDYFMDLVDDWIKHRMRQAESDYFKKEIQPLMDQLDERENALENSKKHIYRKIEDLREQKVYLQYRVKSLTSELVECKQKARDRREQLVKLRKVGEAVQTIQDFVDNGAGEF